MRTSRGRIFPGTGSRLSSRGGIRTLGFTTPDPWKHPWQITPFFDASRQVWTCVIKAGFVNGECPSVVSTAAAPTNPTNWQNFGINPLTGQPFFSAWVFGNNSQSQANAAAGGAGATVWIPLYANPLIDLAYRNIGFDDADGNAIPAFFKALGVNPAIPVDPDNPESSIGTPPPAGNRLLRACDLVLHQPHAGLTSQITLEPGIVTGESNVSQTLALSNPSPGDTLKVFATESFVDEEVSNQIDPLSGDYVSPTFDEIQVGTVFLLSPPGAALYSAPDDTWTPYVRHSLFWNLNWAQPEFRPGSNQATDAFGQLAQLTSVLGDGAGSVAVNFITASLNDAYQAASNMLAANSMAGFFWTPTGGGSTSQFPPAAAVAVTAPSGHGLDKNGLIAAEQAAAAAAFAQQLAQGLDPAFPFVGMEFNTSLLQ